MTPEAADLVPGRETAAGPMSGVRVVDLTIALSGPWAVGLLAEQGADVVKVETPGIGDLCRWIGVGVPGLSAISQMANRGKRSIAVDLKTEAGQDIVRSFVRQADVFVQNFRPGVMDRLGLSAERLLDENPELIYMSISGFGSEGPYRDKSAYDPVVQAYSGLASVQAASDGPPQLIRHTAADKISALTAAQAISAALFARERGRGGQHIEVAMLDAVVNFVWADAAGRESFLDYEGEALSSPSKDQALWRFADGWGIAAPVSDADLAGLCRALGVDGYDAPEVATMVARRANPAAMVALMQRVQDACANLPVAEGMSRMEAEKVPCGRAIAPADLPADPHVQATRLLRESVHPVAGRVRQPRPAARFGGADAEFGELAPMIGQHTDELLGELGLGDAEIDRFRRDGVVA